MSNKVSVLVYSRKVGSAVRKAVLVYFAERASDNGEGVWASKGSIADAIECGRSTVIRTINDFVKEGILREVGKRKHQNGETTEYAMNLDEIARLPKAKTERKNAGAGPVPERDQSQSGTGPVPERDPYQSRSGTQTIIRTINEPPVVRSTRFDEFWNSYPHRGGVKKNRKGAEAKYQQAVRSGVHEQDIIDGVSRMGSDPVVQRGFARDPATWLNQRGWEDEITPQLRAVGGYSSKWGKL